MIHFTVLVITYNRPLLLMRTLRSLSLQTYRNFTVYLIDNGSDRPIGREQLPPDLEVIPIRYDLNQHVGNEVVREMQGTHFAVLADDDVWTPHTLEIVARIYEDCREVETLSVGFSSFDHDSNRLLSDDEQMQSFSAALARTDAFRAGLGHCSKWGIGRPDTFMLPRMAHSSGSFFSTELIRRTVARQGELLIKPFGDIGFVGCCFHTPYIHYLDLPLAVIGRTRNREMDGAAANGRMRWQREVQFIEHSPLKGCSFANMGTDGHLKVLYRNGIDRLWDCTLRFSFFLSHLNQVVTDDPWTDRTMEDLAEAIPFAAESKMREHRISGAQNKAKVEEALWNYCTKVGREHRENSRARAQAAAQPEEDSGCPGGFEDIIGFARWQDEKFVLKQFEEKYKIRL